MIAFAIGAMRGRGTFLSLMSLLATIAAGWFPTAVCFCVPEALALETAHRFRGVWQDPEVQPCNPYSGRWCWSVKRENPCICLNIFAISVDGYPASADDIVNMVTQFCFRTVFKVSRLNDSLGRI